MSSRNTHPTETTTYGFCQLVKYMTESPKLRRFNPIVLTPHCIEIIQYILTKSPVFFERFEVFFNDILVEDDKLDIDKIASIVVLFQYLKQTVYSYKVKHLIYDLPVYTTCKKILTFTLYTLILDERIILSRDGLFVNHMVELMESAVF